MITLVVAISKNGCIGKNGALPWYLPEDLKRFKKLTLGKVVIMGRKTWESLPPKFKPLPNRLNVIITRDENYSIPQDVLKFNSLENAINQFKNHDIAIIGGGQIFVETINIADVLEITRVEMEVEKCDTYFPNIDKHTWKEIKKEVHDEFSFVTYERIKKR